MKKLGIVTGRPYRQSIAVAVSLAQQNSGSIRDDDDSMDSPDPRHHFHPLGRGNPLEELGLYFGSKAAALGLPGLPGTFIWIFLFNMAAFNIILLKFILKK